MSMMIVKGNPFERIRRQSIEERMREIRSRGFIHLDENRLIIRKDNTSKPLTMTEFLNTVYTDREES
jgi:hypothetical protein